MSVTAPLDTLVIPTPCVQILKGRMFAAAYVALKETVETAQVNSISVIKFATLETRGNWSQNVSRNWFWDCYWGRAGQLLFFFKYPTFYFVKLFYTSSDTDECASSQSNECEPNALCTNTEGSYICRCVKGFSGDGTICEGNQ